jgi:hypothetical protein
LGEALPPTDNVVDLLKQDHRNVEDLFKDFEKAEGKSEKLAIIKTILDELTLHTIAEEKLVYSELTPAEEKQEEKVHEAFEEHHLVQGLIAQLSKFTGGEENFEAKVKVLSELIKHHVKEEELDLLPKLDQADVDLDELGRKFQAEKEALKKQSPSFENEEDAIEAEPVMDAPEKAAAKKSAKPVAKKIEAKKPTTKKTAAKKTDTRKPATKKAAAKKPGVKKAAPKKAAAKKKAPAKKASVKKPTAASKAKRKAR